MTLKPLAMRLVFFGGLIPTVCSQSLVDFRFLGAQPGALRALGLCNRTAHLPWLLPEDEPAGLENQGASAAAHWGGANSSTRLSRGDDLAGNAAMQWNFFHVPKCAGTSLTRALKAAAAARGVKVCDGKSSAEGECRDFGAGLVVGHQFYGLVPVTRERGLASIYFTMLRHPIPRVASLYNYIRSSRHHHLHSRVMSMSLVEFVGSERGGEASNEMTRMLCGPRSGPESHRCAGDRSHALLKAKQHLAQDFAAVGLQECFEESVELVSEAVPWIGSWRGLVGPTSSHSSGARHAGRREKEGSPSGAGGPAVVKVPGLSGAPLNRASAEAARQASELSAGEMRAILDLNEWDLELYEYALSLFRKALTRVRDG
mmetsp:Transcript_15942/g.36991  ORF Transcript_15942/g.36991 Transcript_15942/m.36991 type:complete len:372 (-) Transcript_15942:246-1361(-)